MDLSLFTHFDLGEQDGAEKVLRAHNVFSDCVGRSNSLYVHPEAGIRTARLHLSGANNTIIIGSDSNFHGDIVAFGSDSRAAFHGRNTAMNVQVNLYEGADFEIGAGSVIYGMRVWVSEGARLRIGGGCQFSEGITIRTTDHHAIFDIDTLAALNPPADVEIEGYVWLGQDVVILKGARIGAGSIVGARSVVNHRIPRRELWAGSPARRLRDRVSWADSLPASGQEMQDRLEVLAAWENERDAEREERDGTALTAPARAVRRNWFTSAALATLKSVPAFLRTLVPARLRSSGRLRARGDQNA